MIRANSFLFRAKFCQIPQARSREYPVINAGLISKVSDEIATENAENCLRRQPHCRLTPTTPSLTNPREYSRIPYIYRNWLLAYILIWVYLHWNFSGGIRKTHLFCKSAYRPLKVIQGHWLCYESKARMHAKARRSMRLPILVGNSNIGPTLPRFRDIAVFLLINPTHILPEFWGCSRWTRSPMLGSVRAKTHVFYT